MHRLKSMFFNQLTLLSNNLVLMPYLSGIYLDWWFSWLGAGVQKTLKKGENRQKKTSKNEGKEKRRIQGKSNNSNEHLRFYLLFKRSYFVRKHSLKKVVYTIKLYVQVLYALQVIWNVALILHSSYGFVLVFRPHDLLPEYTYVNRLGTTASEKYPHFRKWKKHVARKFFPTP